MNDFVLLFIILGAMLSLVSGIGYTKFRKNYNKIHAAGLNDVTSSFLTLLGLAFASGLNNYTFKLFLVFCLIILNSPISSYLLALFNQSLNNDRK